MQQTGLHIGAFWARADTTESLSSKRRAGSWFDLWTPAVWCRSWSQWSSHMLPFQSPSKRRGEASPLTQSESCLCLKSWWLHQHWLVLCLHCRSWVSGWWCSGTQAPWCKQLPWVEWEVPGGCGQGSVRACRVGVGIALHLAQVCCQPAGIIESQIHIGKDLYDHPVQPLTQYSQIHH